MCLLLWLTHNRACGYLSGCCHRTSKGKGHIPAESTWKQGEAPSEALQLSCAPYSHLQAGLSGQHKGSIAQSLRCGRNLPGGTADSAPSTWLRQTTWPTEGRGLLYQAARFFTLCLAVNSPLFLPSYSWDFLWCG